MNKKILKYPVGDQSFSSIREKGFLYVDKTQYIERIINSSKYYFLGRPRRFGKSLFLSTMKCFFEGKRDLFKGLYADTMDWDWTPQPVFLLDFNTQKFKEKDSLDIFLDSFFKTQETRFNLPLLEENYSIRFASLIKQVAEKTGKKVVILVDEYDKPLVNNIHNKECFEYYRDTLSALYSNFKSSAEYIQLVFLTGVSRFGKLSVFSGLNNIRDISFTNEFAAICGITEEELTNNFKAGIESLAEINNLSFEKEIEKLKSRYDGYHFSYLSPDIYNPFSLIYTFANRAYGNYWIESGTPTLLIEQLKRTDTDIESFLKVECGEEDLKGLDIDNLHPIALFYQTGYLTIKDYDPEFEIFQLGIPNEEVKEGFFKFILPFYSSLGNDSTSAVVTFFQRDLTAGNIEDFIKRLKSFFAGITYEMHLDDERSVQNAMFILFSLIGLRTDVEYRTSDGRIDILIRTKNYIYILELKFDSSAEEAIAQIRKKEYRLPWTMDKRQVVEIGINYSSETRRIEDWIINYPQS
ncbi:MAG: ATP-binding protein [Muribaculaceae bacterium]|nr:ATP-binding protein [Muribaculaceae bacterium]